MEGVAIASSFAGILSCAGQSINGIIKLKAFFSDVSSAPRRISELIRELDDLRDVMTQIEQLVEMLEQTPESKLRGTYSLNTAALRDHTKSCAKNIGDWVAFAERLDPRTEKGIRAFFKKLKVASDKRGFEEFGNKISCHQQRIGISLSVLGRSFDYLGIERIDNLGRKFDGLTEAHLHLSNQINDHTLSPGGPNENQEALRSVVGEQLDPLKKLVTESLSNQMERLSINHSESQDSLRSISESLSSLASHFSQFMGGGTVEPHFKQQSPELSLEWCCDALSGIDDAFEEGENRRTCLYCYKVFSWKHGTDHSYIRGKHLADSHAFGACNLAISYQTWPELQRHLVNFHSMDAGAASIQQHVFRKKKPMNLFRGDLTCKGQPFTQEKSPSTLSLILHCKLQSVIGDISPGMMKDMSLVLGCTSYQKKIANLLGLLECQLDYGSKVDLFKHMDVPVACIEEELMVSNNEDLVILPIHSPEQSYINSYFKSERIHGLAVRRFQDQRHSINYWFMEVFRFSRPTRVLLRNGRIVSGMRPKHTDWVLESLKFLEGDGTSNGSEPSYNPSDGAIDSRDSLKSALDDPPWKCPIETCNYHEYGWPTEGDMERHFSDKHAATSQT